MSSPLHEIDKLFRDGIESRSEYPPQNVWDNIESELDKETVINNYKRKYTSLKRRTSILLILLLGVIIYGRVRLNEQRNQLGSQHGSAASAQMQPVNADNSTQAMEGKRPVQPTNIVSEKREDTKTGQQPIVNNRRVKETDDTENNLAKTEPGKASGSQSYRQKVTISKQVLHNRISGSNEDFTTVSPAMVTTGEVSDGSISSAVSSAIDNSKTQYSEGRVKRPLSLQMITTDDSWKKDITSNLRPAVINRLPLSTNYDVAKKSGAGRSRFSLALQLSTMSNWNTITENEEYDRWRRGRASNGNGSGTGNANGNGNSNGNWGGTNGSGGNWGGHHDDRHDLKNSEHNQVAYSGGIILGYSINKRLSLQTGLTYHLNSSKIKDKKIYADKDSSGKLSYLLNCSAGYTNFSPPEGTIPRVRDSIMISDTRNFSSYLGIPLTVEYRILSAGKFSLSASAGGRANLLLMGKTKAVLGKGTSNETMETADTEGLKPAYFSALASITGEMQLNKNISVTIAPAGQFGLTNVNEKRSVKTRTNYLGLTAGLKLRL